MSKTLISEVEVYSQLDTITNSPLFKGSKVLTILLKFIVKETLEGRGMQLKGYTIAIGALGYKHKVDEHHLAMVRIYAGRLRKLLQRYYSNCHDGDEIIIKIPKGGYNPRFVRMSKTTCVLLMLLINVV
ncbi:hypothetical protein [Filimonas lacunae]|nr:hypothetical protein [Filimonas lacunae]BAV07426.1 adenylate cyclase protein [Filimonas lacunae]